MLFHEYAHHLAHLGLINIDAGLMIKELYELRPEMQSGSLDEALLRSTRRSELFAICSATAMMVEAGASEQQIARVASRSVAESGLKTHGSAQAQELVRKRGSHATSLSDCNSWSWPDTD